MYVRVTMNLMDCSQIGISLPVLYFSFFVTFYIILLMLKVIMMMMVLVVSVINESKESQFMKSLVLHESILTLKC